MYIKNPRPPFFLRHQNSCAACAEILKNNDSFFIAQKTNTYSDEIYSYSLLKEASALIVCNKNREIGQQDCLDILYSLEQNKQIVMLETPVFAQEVPLFTRQLIIKKLSKILLLDLTLFDTEDYISYTSNIGVTPINYTLTRHELTLSRSLLKQYFRKLEKLAH